MTSASPLDRTLPSRRVPAESVSSDLVQTATRARVQIVPPPTQRVPVTDPTALAVQITLCVVVAALLLAIIALPKSVSVATVPADEGRELALRTGLARLRSAIQSYRLDHCDWPGGVDDGNDTARPVFVEEQLERHLTMCSDDRGRISPAPAANRPFGPYLDGPLPENPINGRTSVRILDEGEAWPDQAGGRAGWIYDAETGELRADCVGTTAGTGIRFYDL
jgi:hypothetical protein